MKKIFFVLIVCGMFFSAGFGIFLRPFLYTLTPLQRHYLGAYLTSSWKAGEPSARTDVRWIWKMKPEAESEPKRGAKDAPKFQYALATENDLIPVPAKELLWKGDVLPFHMTQEAAAEGWSGVVWFPPVAVNSAQLAALLRRDFFEDEPAWRFFVQPFLLIALSIVLWLAVRSWREARYDRNPWRAPLPFWQRWGQKAFASGVNFRRRLEARRAPLELPPTLPVRTIEAVRTEPKPGAAKQALASAQATSEAAPVAARPKTQTTQWDESKGIE